MIYERLKGQQRCIALANRYALTDSDYRSRYSQHRLPGYTDLGDHGSPASLAAPRSRSSPATA